MSMNPEQLDAYLSGELGTDSARFFESAMRRDESLRREVCEQAQIDQALHRLFAIAGAGAEREPGSLGTAQVGGDPSDHSSREAILAAKADEFADGVMASISTHDEESLARSVLTEILDEREKRSRPGPWWDLAKAAAVAGIAVLATVMVLRSVEVTDERSEARRAAVEKQRLLARVTREHNAVWGRSNAFALPTETEETEELKGQVGRWLGAGLLHLESDAPKSPSTTERAPFLKDRPTSISRPPTAPSCAADG